MADQAGDVNNPPHWRSRLFAAYPYYGTWWMVWAVVLNGLQPVDTSRVDFWMGKSLQVLWGALIGLISGLIFTLAQNAMNRERGKAKAWVFAIVIWIGVGFGSVTLFKAVQSSLITRAANENIDKMRADAINRHPNMTVSEAVKQDAIQQADVELASQAGDKTKQSSTAASMFLGFLLLNTRSRVEYCAARGVDISGFKIAMESLHRNEITRAKAIYAGEKITQDQLFDVLKPQLQKQVEMDMQDVAKSLHTDAHGACKAISDHAQDMANAMELSKVNPAVEKALMGL